VSSECEPEQRENSWKVITWKRNIIKGNQRGELKKNEVRGGKNYFIIN
jgi:hypothetical protein